MLANDPKWLCWKCHHHDATKHTVIDYVNPHKGKSKGSTLHINGLCNGCIDAERNDDPKRLWLAWSIYLPVVRPDNATPEQIISVEVLLTRWIEFLALCVALPPPEKPESECQAQWRQTLTRANNQEWDDRYRKYR